jgi:hypothetical protein
MQVIKACWHQLTTLKSDTSKWNTVGCNIMYVGLYRCRQSAVWCFQLFGLQVEQLARVFRV